MQSSKGFTLIELIAVIAISGVLTAVAVPRFVDMSSEARHAAIKSLYGTVKSVVDQTKLQAIVKGVGSAPRVSPRDSLQFYIGGLSMELKYGYPEAYAESSRGSDIIDLINPGDRFEVCYSVSCISSNSSRVKIGFDTTEGTGCYIRYSEPGGTGAASDTEYGLIMVTVGC
jgi:MSHA pilin protein MshA